MEPLRLAIDTETTGPDLNHGCLPFGVSLHDSKGEWWWFDADVDSHTRIPKWSRSQIDSIRNLIIQYDHYEFHNANFDILACSLIGIDFLQILSQWQVEIHDTIIRSHAIDSYESHKLKDLALRYCNLLDDDEAELKEAVVKAGYIGRRLGWNVARKGHPMLPSVRGKMYTCDYWLPKAVCKYADKHPEDKSLKEYRDPQHPWRKVCETYGVGDVERTIILSIVQDEMLEADGLVEQYEAARRLIPVVRRIETRGIDLIPESLDREFKRYNSQVVKHENRFRELISNPDFNLDSSPQKIKLFVHDLGMPILKVGKEKKDGSPPDPSFDKDVVAALLDDYYTEPTRERLILKNLQSRGLNNTATTYLKNYQRNMRIVGGRTILLSRLNQTGTKTTRFSHSNPNSANVSKGKDVDEFDDQGKKLIDFKLRDVFGPSPGRIWYSKDYSQLQLRIFAFASQDERLIQAFEDGWDAHDFMAKSIFGLDDDDKPNGLQRRIGKNVNFGFIFGAGEHKIDATAGMPGLYSTVRGMFPDAAKFMDATIRQVRKCGYVYTMGGYKLIVPRGMAYAGVNYIVQGTEGEIVKDAMVEIDDYLYFSPEGPTEGRGGYDYASHFMFMQVHDELDFDFPVPTNARERQQHRLILARIRDIMEGSAEKFGVVAPVDCEVVHEKWSEGVPFDLPERIAS